MLLHSSPILTVMTRAVRKAARGMVRDFGEVEQLQVSKKGPADFVSVADTRAESILHEELSRARPEYGFLMEESGAVAGKDPSHRFIIDPLDGTLNFLHGIPHFAISVALERNGDIVAGVIYDPLRDELFYAEKGTGAFMNDRRLRVSARTKLVDSLIATGIPFVGRRHHIAYLAMLEVVVNATSGVRRFGSASLDLTYVAAGRYDGFWETGLSPWDIAAGILLVREAGGYVSEVEGGHRMLETGSVLAANDHLHLPLGKLLRDAIAQGSARAAG
ncbi:MAG: inositol monophosphatase family protein [Alphaproteobacteria bacterium]